MTDATELPTTSSSPQWPAPRINTFSPEMFVSPTDPVGDYGPALDRVIAWLRHEYRIPTS